MLEQNTHTQGETKYSNERSKRCVNRTEQIINVIDMSQLTE